MIDKGAKEEITAVVFNDGKRIRYSREDLKIISDKIEANQKKIVIGTIEKLEK